MRRSVWFWVTLVWLALMMSANLYDERLIQSSTFLGQYFGNLIYLILLLFLSYFYNWGYVWGAVALMALGVLALIAAAHVDPTDAAIGIVDLVCASGLLRTPYQPARAAASPPSPKPTPTPRYAPRPGQRRSPPRS